MWQAEHVAALLANLGIKTELVPLVSSGDVDMRPIDGKRQVGVFTKRIQQALIDDEADVAVHSMKDLPTEVDERLVVAAIPQRETVADCLVSPSKWAINDLPQGAKIGTGSKRRAAQLLALRSDLDIQSIRGNVQTRLGKLDDGEYDAIILANAGLLRLKMDDLARSVLPLEQMLPAPGQGALAIEVRSDDDAALGALAQIDDPFARAATTAERTLLSNLNGGCLAPIAAFAELTPGKTQSGGTQSSDAAKLHLQARVLSTNGRQQLADSGECDLDQDDPASWFVAAKELATKISKRLEKSGARKLIEQAR
ncbi:Porphobilinogen deaminase [Planctomycetes bacterium K23_9]|uniref:Hydroxymethylbilane synthase n=2 Tax=Stieleria marina TaxID=1930275 RepID=A0A517NNI2_9BACT|nr:Porphobilinogen deaminase [Planctomycetes bacterium K23_9]